MRSDSEMPMVEDVCRLQWLDARTCPIVSVALVRAHLPWWQQLIHRFHVWQRNEFQLQIILTISMHRVDIVIYRNKCKIYSKIEKRAFLLLLWPQWRSCLGLQMSPNWTFALLCVKFALMCCPAWTCKVCGHGQLRLKKSPPVGDAISRIQLDPDAFWWGFSKRPSFWVRSERCAVATSCLARADDLLLEAVRSNQKTGAEQGR